MHVHVVHYMNAWVSWNTHTQHEHAWNVYPKPVLSRQASIVYPPFSLTFFFEKERKKRKICMHAYDIPYRQSLGEGIGNCQQKY